MIQWYALRCATRQEKRACDWLKSELGLAVYCPMETRLWRHARKSEVRTYPLFPGYVFARLIAEDVADIEADKYNGISSVVGKPTEFGRGSPVPEGFIAWLAAHEHMGAFNRAWKPLPPTLTNGRKVKVVSGKLAGCLGQIAKANGQNKFLVAMEAKGIFFNDIEFHRHELEPA